LADAVHDAHHRSFLVPHSVELLVGATQDPAGAWGNERRPGGKRKSMESRIGGLPRSDCW
jgi:hypothetical protein